MTQANIFAALTETNATATAISAAAEAKKAARTAKAEKAAAAAISADKKTTAKKAPAKAADKPAKAPAAKKVTKPVEAAISDFDAAAALQLFIDCVHERNTLQFSADNESNLSYLRNVINRNELLASMTAAHNAGFDLEAVFKMMTNTQKGDNYIAVKVITKIRMLFVALALNNFERCDSFTKPILLNVATVGALDTHDMCRTVSKRVTSDDVLRVSKQVENKKDSSVGTASTQASSTRNALGYIGVLNVKKGQKNDAAAWADTKQARAVQDLVNGYNAKFEQARAVIEQAHKAAAHA